MANGSVPDWEKIEPKEYMKHLMEMESISDHMKDALLYGTPLLREEEKPTATQIMMEEKSRVSKHEYYHQKYGGTVTGRITNGGRGHGKSLIPNWPFQSTLASAGVRRTQEDQFAFPPHVFQTEHQRLMMMPDQITAPTTTQQDRQYLGMTVPEYQNFSECIQRNSYLNRDGNQCKLKNAKTKKLKNIRHTIRKSPFLMASLIWQAQLRIIEAEITKRRGIPRHAQP
ncbi:hypothetical protein [Sulfitobacter phage vB_SupP_AX]|nr:hypothetical protein [Sulfitobacter phage vB_SupP_AX]